MTPEEINKKAYEKYPVAMDQRTDSLGFGDFNAPPRQGYIEAYKEISALPTIKGWVARDKHGLLWLYRVRPERRSYWWYSGETDQIGIDKALFPALRWEDEPIEVELPIIRK